MKLLFDWNCSQPNERYLCNVYQLRIFSHAAGPDVGNSRAQIILEIKICNTRFHFGQSVNVSLRVYRKMCNVYQIVINLANTRLI